MSVISSLSKAHKVHNFHFFQPTDLNHTVAKGYVQDLFSSGSDRRIGFVVLNGNTNYVDIMEISQVNFSLVLDNGSLSMNTQFHFTRDSIGKITFPAKVLARDANGRMIMMTLKQHDIDLSKVLIGVQII